MAPKRPRESSCSRSKRRVYTYDDPKVFGDLGDNSIAKPIQNKDIPANAQVVNINIIPDNRSLQLEFSKGSAKQYGNTLEYKFAECECACDCSVITANTMVNTAEIYDIDAEDDKKLPDDIDFYVLDHKAATRDVYKYSGTPGSGVEYKISDSAHGATRQPKNGKVQCILYVVSADKQKLLGDWIATNSHTSGASNGKLFEITPWMFDDFCNVVKPMYAKHSYLLRNSTNFVPVGRYGDGTQPTGTGADLPLPDGGTVTSTYTWHERVFKREQDDSCLTPSDTYASKLLIGQLSSFYTLGINHCLRLRILFRKVRLQAQTLFFNSLTAKRTVTDLCQTLGDRKEYGTPDHGGQTHPQLPDQAFNGVITCQHGTLDFFNEGKMNLAGADTNVLQDTAKITGAWY